MFNKKNVALPAMIFTDISSKSSGPKLVSTDPAHLLYHDDFIVYLHRGIQFTVEASFSELKNTTYLKVRAGTHYVDPIKMRSIEEAREVIHAIATNESLTEDGCVNIYEIIHSLRELDSEEGDDETGECVPGDGEGE